MSSTQYKVLFFMELVLDTSCGGRVSVVELCCLS